MDNPSLLAQKIGESTNLADKELAKFKELAAARERRNRELVEPRWWLSRPAAKKDKPAATKPGWRNTS